MRDFDLSAGASMLWGNDARCVIEISGALLEILYYVYNATASRPQSKTL